MGHQHGHEPCKGHDPKSRRAEKALWAVAFLSAIFMATEFVGGFWADSLAIMADAAHMLSDFGSFIISIIAIRCARLAATSRHTFGYKRVEVLGAMASILLLWGITVYLVVVAVQRIIDNDTDVDPNIMLITAGVGVVFNVIMMLVLKLGGLGHSHGAGGHDHSHDGKNVNVRAALIHVMGDFIQSIGVVIAALVIKYTGYTLADPICTFLFSIVVLFTTIHVMKDIFFVLMEAKPKTIDSVAVKNELFLLEGVKGVHDLHLWSIGMEQVACSVHLGLEYPDLALKTVTYAEIVLRIKFGIYSATIQVEHFDEEIEANGTCQKA